ncbi:MAG: SPFH domain-containing protein, partial [Firmicutes bacterium]|nr:SPFH domain-containing protein [Bacillota bacterium]
MKEKVLSNRKNGMAMLILWALLYLAAVPVLIIGINGYLGFASIPAVVLAILWFIVGWIPFLGLKVIGPQEALVLTLFGNYYGSIKEQGFYWVNPFCVSVNPAAKTKLSQSGDVESGDNNNAFVKALTGGTEITTTNKKISLKVMTLSNSRQKINDCLGNPVEIGIAVMWRVVDTAKAVFNVDNYKEYLSLQCDSALRNIVRIYPYDVAPNVDT